MVYFTQHLGMWKDPGSFTAEDMLYGRYRTLNVRTTDTSTEFGFEDSYCRSFDIAGLESALKAFNKKYGGLEPKYKVYKIAKKTGGFRTICDPNADTRECLYALKDIFDKYCDPMYHNASYAYIHGRRTIDALKVHQKNGSLWFMKTDFSKFFDSFLKEGFDNLIVRMAPFCYLDRYQLVTALSKCFFKGCLPQGSPMSPTLTNIVMIPFDVKMEKVAGRMGLVYTRYCDDILFSSKQTFRPEAVINVLNQVIAETGMPLKLKTEKTRYGSRKGRNWNLGLMLNSENNITVGHETKKQFKAAAHHMIMKAEKDPSKIREFRGLLSYYKSIEPGYFNYVVHKYANKFGKEAEKILM